MKLNLALREKSTTRRKRERDRRKSVSGRCSVPLRMGYLIEYWMHGSTVRGRIIGAFTGPFMGANYPRTRCSGRHVPINGRVSLVAIQAMRGGAHERAAIGDRAIGTKQQLGCTARIRSMIASSREPASRPLTGRERPPSPPPPCDDLSFDPNDNNSNYNRMRSFCIYHKYCTYPSRLQI